MKSAEITHFGFLEDLEVALRAFRGVGLGARRHRPEPVMRISRKNPSQDVLEDVDNLVVRMQHSRHDLRENSEPLQVRTSGAQNVSMEERTNLVDRQRLIAVDRLANVAPDATENFGEVERVAFQLGGGGATDEASQQRAKKKGKKQAAHPDFLALLTSTSIGRSPISRKIVRRRGRA